MQVRALLFDVFGTLVDWRGSVAREAERVLAPLGHVLDWHTFADAWRAEYQPALARVRDGRRRYTTLDVLHRENLERVLPTFGVGAIADATLEELTLAWHRLDAWPDSVPALARLRTRFWLAPVSNGNITLMVGIARHNGFVWDAVLGADLARDFKPRPLVYLRACQALSLPPGACLMVAAHASDLLAAATCGLRTAFVARPLEHGPGHGADTPPPGSIDYSASDLADLARQLGG
jgi:2-haloacid dehalogenase